MILAVGILAVSTASLLIRFAQVEAPSLVIAAGRMLVATVVIAPVAITWHRDELKSLSQKQWLLLVLGEFSWGSILRHGSHPLSSQVLPVQWSW